MIRKLARPMLASVYVADGVDTLLNTNEHVEGTQAVINHARTVLPYQYARQIPRDPELVARSVGATKVAAGTLLALGKFPRTSAGVLALVSVPTILARHAFWETQDPAEKKARRNGFTTSVALLGGLFIASADTAGKPGLKWRATRAAKDANKVIQQALPTRSETEKFADSAQETASAFAENARTFIGEAAGAVSNYADQAREYVDDNKDDWLARAQDNAKAAKTRLVKAAAQAQARADELSTQAESYAGRKSKKLHKSALAYQKRADKAVARAQKKLAKRFDI